MSSTLTAQVTPTSQTICSGSPVAVLQGTIGNGATIATWTGAGTFAPDNTTLNVTYTPTAAEITAGTATVTLTGSVPGGACMAATAMATISIIPGPTVSAGPNQTVCGNNPNTLLAGAYGGTASLAFWTGAGTFNRNIYQTNAIYTPTAAEIAAGSATLTLTTDDPPGACGPVSSTMTITINPAPIVTVAGNQTICSGSDTATLGGALAGSATGGVWTSSGTGSFLPDTTTLSATYHPSAADIAAGTVTLTLHATGQLPPCVATANVVVTIHLAVTASAGANQTICADHSTAGLGGIVGGGATGGIWTASPGGGTFTPNATTLNATYTPSADDKTAGAATLTLTTTGQLDPCPAATAPVVVTIYALPAITGQPTDLTVCEDSPATFAATTTGTALTYQWQVSYDFGSTWEDVTDATNASYTIPSASFFADDGSLYQIIVSGACSPAVTSAPPAFLTVNQLATAQAGPNQTVCASSPAATMAGSFGGGANMSVWTGAGTFSPNATNQLNAVYTPTAAEIAAHTATVTLYTRQSGSGLSAGVLDDDDYDQPGGHRERGAEPDGLRQQPGDALGGLDRGCGEQRQLERGRHVCAQHLCPQRGLYSHRGSNYGGHGHLDVDIRRSRRPLWGGEFYDNGHHRSTVAD